MCTWHPDRATALSCTRCGRPACPDCLTPASVGFHCTACVAESRSTQRKARTASGSAFGQLPLVTSVLVAINLVMFVITVLQARSVTNLWPSTVYQRGSLIPVLVSSGEYWRLATAAFLHGGLLHIAVNMYSLYVVGNVLERMIGRGRFLTIYLVSLFASSVSVMLFSAPVSLTIGASGAIFGIFGALIVAFKRFHYRLTQLAVVLVINLVIMFRISGISWQAHLGGLIVGALLGVAMVYPGRQRRVPIQIASVVVIIAVVAGLLVYRDGQIGTWMCQYTSTGLGCLPHP